MLTAKEMNYILKADRKTLLKNEDMYSLSLWSGSMEYFPPVNERVVYKNEKIYGCRLFVDI